MFTNIFKPGEDGSFVPDESMLHLPDEGLVSSVNPLKNLLSTIEMNVNGRNKETPETESNFLQALRAEVQKLFEEMQGKPFEGEKADRLVRFAIQLGITYQRFLLRELEAASKSHKIQSAGIRNRNADLKAKIDEREVKAKFAELQKKNPKLSDSRCEQLLADDLHCSQSTIQRRRGKRK